MLALISVLLLILCMLAPLKRAEPAQKHPWIRPGPRITPLFGGHPLAPGVAHGILAGSGPAMMTGKLGWMLLLILTVLTPLKKKTKQVVWRRIHIALGAAVCVLMVVHIVQSIIM